MKRTIAATGMALAIASQAHANCASFVNNYVDRNSQIQSLSRQHFIVGPAFEDVLEEMFWLLADSPYYMEHPEDFTFDAAAPALGSLAAFVVVCAANEPHCSEYLRKVDRIWPDVLMGFVLGAGYAGC